MDTTGAGTTGASATTAGDSAVIILPPGTTESTTVPSDATTVVLELGPSMTLVDGRTGFAPTQARNAKTATKTCEEK